MSHSHSGPPAPPNPESLRRGHEVSDAAPKSLVIFGIALTVTLIVVVAITLVLFKIFAAQEDRTNADAYVTSPLTDARPPSPAPPLQPSLGVTLPDGTVVGGHLTLPYQDAAALRDEYVRLAGTYGQDKMADHVVHDRMPVEAAIDILADQGMPENTAADIPTPIGPANSVPMPFSDGGRGSKLGVAAAPGVPQK